MKNKDFIKKRDHRYWSKHEKEEYRDFYIHVSK